MQLRTVDDKRGFTLIELLVVVAIIGILTGVAIASYNSFNRSQIVQRAALQLKSDLRESENRAFSGLKDIDCKADVYDSTGGGLMSPLPDNVDDYNLKGHFVTFDISSPDLYTRAQDCTPNPGQATPAPDLIRPSTPESTSLPTPAVITNLQVVGALCSLSPSKLVINFKSLQGVSFYTGTDDPTDDTNLLAATCTKAKITVSDGTTGYEIDVDTSGQIVEKKL